MPCVQQRCPWHPQPQGYADREGGQYTNYHHITPIPLLPPLSHGHVAHGFPHLQEAADRLFIVRSHGNHVVKQPEKWTLLVGTRFGVVKDSVELKEQATSPLCGSGGKRQG